MFTRTSSPIIPDPTGPLLPKGRLDPGSASPQPKGGDAEKPEPRAGDRLELSHAGDLKTNPKARDAQQKKETTPESPEKPVVKAPGVMAQEEAVSRAMAGEIVVFPTMAGEQPVLRISGSDRKVEAGSAFRVTMEGSSFELEVAQGLDAKEHVAKLLEYVSKVPRHLRPVLKSVSLENHPNPQDAYWAKVYGRDTFASAATAGGGAITFWNLAEKPYNLNEEVFNHELAHLFGAGYSESHTRHAEMIPPGWEEAMQADGDKVSDYAGSNPNEDFAETWRYYLVARKTPEALKAFEEKYPNRVKILEPIYHGAYEGCLKVGLLDPELLKVPEKEGLRFA